MKTGWKTLGALMLAIFFVGSVQADEISLGALIKGESITAGDKTFSEWEVFFSDSYPDPLADPGSIMVSSLDDGGLDPGPGLSYAFNNALNVTGIADDDDFAYLDFGWSYVVTPADGLLIKDVSMGRSGSCGLCLDLGWVIEQAVFGADGDLLGTLFDIWDFDLDGDLYSDGLDNLDFAGQDSLYVETNVYLFALEEGGNINLSNLTQRFSQEVAAVPEPGTLALLGIGLLGLAASRRRKLKI